MTTTQTITTADTYDDDLALARVLLAERMAAPTDGERDDLVAEYRRTQADVLNNTWVEGCTIAEWVSQATNLLSRPNSAGA